MMYGFWYVRKLDSQQNEVKGYAFFIDLDGPTQTKLLVMPRKGQANCI